VTRTRRSVLWWCLAMFVGCSHDTRNEIARSVPGFFDECSADTDCRMGQKCLNFPEGNNLDKHWCQITCEAPDGGTDQSQCPKDFICVEGQHGSELPKCEPYGATPNRPLILLGPHGERLDGGIPLPAQ
jgi:hypothetical protein